MYTPKNEAEGLLISNQKEIEPIDLGTSKTNVKLLHDAKWCFYINEKTKFTLMKQTNSIKNINQKKSIHRRLHNLALC